MKIIRVYNVEKQLKISALYATQSYWLFAVQNFIHVKLIYHIIIFDFLIILLLSYPFFVMNMVYYSDKYGRFGVNMNSSYSINLSQEQSKKKYSILSLYISEMKQLSGQNMYF